jgi:hypothetical protein
LTRVDHYRAKVYPQVRAQVACWTVLDDVDVCWTSRAHLVPMILVAGRREFADANRRPVCRSGCAVTRSEGRIELPLRHRRSSTPASHRVRAQ